MVTAEQLRKLYYAEPFVPFVLILEDGKKVRVKAPTDFMFAAPSKKIAYPAGGGVVGLISFDRVNIEMTPRKPTRHRKAS